MQNLAALLQQLAQPTLVALLGLSFVAGLIAVVSPERFKAFSQKADRWVDTSNLLSVLDRPINVDDYVLRHTRLFGLVVLVSVGILAFTVATTWTT